MVRGSRQALVAVFVANGLGLPSFFARLPERQRALELSDTGLGLTILGVALGALLISPLCGTLVHRWTSRRVAVGAGLVVGAGLWAAGAAPNAPVLFAVLAVLGAADAAMDVAMNANGAAHEVATGRSSLQGLHAAWSIGALSAAGLAALAAHGGVSPTAQLGGAGALVVALALAASGTLGSEDPVPEPAPAGADGARWRHRHRVLLVLGGAVVAGALLEAAASDWSSVQLDRLGVSEGVAPLGFAAFMAGMVLGRLVGDRRTDALGAATVLRRGMALCAGGLALGAATGRPVPFCIGAAAAGFGLSGFFPAVFSAAARVPGVRAGTGPAVVSIAARAGFLAAPVLVGVVADASDLRVAFAGAGALALALAWSAPRFLSPRTGSGPQPLR